MVAIGTRRSFLVTGLAAAASPGTLRAATVEAGGLLTQSWFLQSFLDLREDLEGAAAAGKRLAILVEQKGCPFCRDLHLVNFADPAVTAYIRERFEIVQLDLHGSREITDLDGAKYEEKVFARRIAGQMTPVAIFLPARPEEVGGRPAHEAAVAKMPGYLPPGPFLALFRYVAEEAYRRESFEAYLRRAS
ncbi:MAG: thioredoxin family protein [Geminicoccaceae bacterium]|nr:thioredoxin family protein [Geminicoccaceae bacterium]MCS7268071.1 thioredoxin family protein [Geminicoccaceae bacterium]MCX7631381.1 thioredoxin family protein [Geminicoccaceae bacterium]MDW8124783.1 thioredoxin family protein [Geminicoccaceae bacterium]MDW8342361.1 thioredoxin family protein [Geminicoccaceae bacterium]